MAQARRALPREARSPVRPWPPESRRRRVSPPGSTALAPPVSLAQDRPLASPRRWFQAFRQAGSLEAIPAACSSRQGGRTRLGCGAGPRQHRANTVAEGRPGRHAAGDGGERVGIWPVVDHPSAQNPSVISIDHHAQPSAALRTLPDERARSGQRRNQSPAIMSQQTRNLARSQLFLVEGTRIGGRRRPGRAAATTRSRSPRTARAPGSAAARRSPCPRRARARAQGCVRSLNEDRGTEAGDHAHIEPSTVGSPSPYLSGDCGERWTMTWTRSVRRRQ